MSVTAAVAEPESRKTLKTLRIDAELRDDPVRSDKDIAKLVGTEVKLVAARRAVMTDLEARRPQPLDTRVEPYLRIVNATLDDDPTSKVGLVLNGRIDCATLRFLKIDDYQRKLEPRDDIRKALQEGIVLPNVELGVRGQDVATEGDDYVIKSPTYIIDGWQRVGNVREFLETSPDRAVRLFATVHFNTNRDWETARFDALNKNRKKISPNHHLRNMRSESNAVLTLYGLCHSDKESPLYKRVCWAQTMQRGELFTALTMAKAGAFLHQHIVAKTDLTVAGTVDGLEKTIDRIGMATFRRNMQTFYGLIDEAWPFREIDYRRSAPQTKGAFMSTLARLFSQHAIFWEANGKVLDVNADDRRKLAKFPLGDPQVMHLASSGGPSRHLLYQMLVNHMNSGRRDRRLQTREPEKK